MWSVLAVVVAAVQDAVVLQGLCELAVAAALALDSAHAGFRHHWQDLRRRSLLVPVGVEAQP
jgi:hypothetical protein